MKYCFGVDIGGTTVKLGLFSEAGAIVEKWEIVTRTENEGAAILPDVAEAINTSVLFSFSAGFCFTYLSITFIRGISIWGSIPLTLKIE